MMTVRRRLFGIAFLVSLSLLALGLHLLRPVRERPPQGLRLTSRFHRGANAADLPNAQVALTTDVQSANSSERQRDHQALVDKFLEEFGEDEDDESAPPANPQDNGDYKELFSLTTRNRRFIDIFFGGDAAYNPNIIPHPTQHDMWIVVAQHEQSKEQIDVSQELMCVAGFLNGVLVCTEAPIALPIAPSISGVCDGELAYLNFRHGPRDARMFYGPDGPLIVYGSQSQYTCLGIWIQDVRMMLDAFHLERFALSKLFVSATELRRPAPWKGVEKNFFLFWDFEGRVYVHHDISPGRVFAQLDFDGTVGEDLAPAVADHDNTCLAQYLPSVGPEQESVHQATNSLSITLCKRADPGCTANENNTFIMHVFHHKTYYDFHGIYEPYVLLFRQAAPFALHGISQRPLWIHGRQALTAETGALQYAGRPAEDIPEGHTEMFYVTSISWKGHAQRYHGYLDDVVFLGFGIEDTRAGLIDVLAEDLVGDLGLC